MTVDNRLLPNRSHWHVVHHRMTLNGGFERLRRVWRSGADIVSFCATQIGKGWHCGVFSTVKHVVWSFQEAFMVVAVPKNRLVITPCSDILAARILRAEFPCGDAVRRFVFFTNDK